MATSILALGPRVRESTIVLFELLDVHPSQCPTDARKKR
jgi:hypothetical protein